MFTQEQIDHAYEVLKSLSVGKSEGKLTGQQKCIQYMMDHHYQIWFWSWDFCSKRLHNGEWLSHKGQARISDLAIQHPELVETRKIGRFHCYRLRTENMDEIDKFLIF